MTDAKPLKAATLPLCRLERLLGKPRGTWTIDDLVTFYVDEGLRLVSLKHVGADGSLKTLDFVPSTREHLYAILSAGERADGSSLFSGLGIHADRSDILLRPRLRSAFVDPFAREPTLALLCSHVGRDGLPLPESPDSIVRAADETLRRETGVELLALGEVEYFLGRHAMTPDTFGASDRGYHASSPVVFGEALRRDALLLLGEIGVPIKYGHSEVGYIQASETEGVLWEQHEIELALAPLPEAAEAIVLTQWVLRNLAQRADLLCSFDPIVRRGHAGSGLHVHFAPTIEGAHRGGFDEEGQLHEAARWMIGGLVTLGAALMAFGNRKEGSLIRLHQAKEAPSGVAWGQFDRSALIRLPLQVTNARGDVVTPPTIEFRLADGSAHPHLLLAGGGQALLEGKMTEDLAALVDATCSSRPGGADKNIVTQLPRSLAEIAVELERRRASFERHEVFAPHVIDAIIAESAA